MILAIDAIPAVSICLGGLWITILILFLWIDEVSFEEIELFFVLNIGCIIETELVEVAEYLLDEDGPVELGIGFPNLLQTSSVFI